jgi:hypothetical protein
LLPLVVTNRQRQFLKVADMITINLYQYSDRPNIVNKVLPTSTAFNGLFYNRQNVLRPSVIIRNSGAENADFSAYNYAYIADLKRYYFVANVEILDKDRVLLSLSVDVLKTYETAILAATGTINAKENAAADISTRAAIYDRKPIFQKLEFSENTPFNSDGVILMTTLKGKTV